MRSMPLLVAALLLAACSSTGTTPAEGSGTATASSSGSGGGGGNGGGDGGTGGGGDGGGGDGGGGGAGGDAPETIAGKILFRGLWEGWAFVLEYYQVPQPNRAPRSFGDGHCEVTLSPEEGDNIAGSFFIHPDSGNVDLGEAVTASSGDLSLIATRLGDPKFEYAASIAGPPFAFGETFTLVNSGALGGFAAGTLATVTVPGQVFPIPSTVEVGSEPLTITYSGGEGAMFFHVSIQGSKGTVDCYPAPSTTSFTLPAEVMPVLDKFVTPAVSAETIAYLTTDAGPVLVRVSADNFD